MFGFSHQLNCHRNRNQGTGPAPHTVVEGITPVSLELTTPTPLISCILKPADSIITSGELKSLAIKTAPGGVTLNTFTAPGLYMLSAFNDDTDDKDTYDFVSGVHTQKIGERWFDGTESGWYLDPSSTADFKCFSIDIPDSLDSLADDVHFYANQFGRYAGLDNNSAYHYNHHTFRFCMAATNIADLAAWKAFLASQASSGNYLDLFYRLNTPIVTTPGTPTKITIPAQPIQLSMLDNIEVFLRIEY